jgi:hypothetical protein
MVWLFAISYWLTPPNQSINPTNPNSPLTGLLRDRDRRRSDETQETE